MIQPRPDEHLDRAKNGQSTPNTLPVPLLVGGEVLGVILMIGMVAVQDVFGDNVFALVLVAVTLAGLTCACGWALWRSRGSSKTPAPNGSKTSGEGTASHDAGKQP